MAFGPGQGEDKVVGVGPVIPETSVASWPWRVTYSIEGMDARFPLLGDEEGEPVDEGWWHMLGSGAVRLWGSRDWGGP